MLQVNIFFLKRDWQGKVSHIVSKIEFKIERIIFLAKINGITILYFNGKLSETAAY